MNSDSTPLNEPQRTDDDLGSTKEQLNKQTYGCVLCRHFDNCSLSKSSDDSECELYSEDAAYLSEIKKQFLKVLDDCDFGEPFMRQIINHPESIFLFKRILLAGAEAEDPYYHKGKPGQMLKSVKEGLPIFDDDLEYNERM